MKDLSNGAHSRPTDANEMKTLRKIHVFKSLVAGAGSLSIMLISGIPPW
jgi:hypothetical protein